MADAPGQTSNELFASLMANKQEVTPVTDSIVSTDESQAQTEVEGSELSPMERFDQMSQPDEAEVLAEEASDDLAANSDESEDSLPSLASPSSEDSVNADIEEVLVKGSNGRKQKLKIDYSDRGAIKKAHLLAAGMRKFQAERDVSAKAVKPIETAFGKPIHEIAEDVVSLKNDFDKIEQAYEEHGAKGIVELLGGEAAWMAAVDGELSQRDYLSNLSAEEKYQLETKKREESFQKQIGAERGKREEFQKQIEAKEEQANLMQLESKLHPAFDRYRFAGKLGDPATENLYDESIWDKVKQRLGEYPDTLELSQAVIDKEFRTVATMFRKHIKVQAEKQFKKTVENKKADTAQRAQMAAKKGLSGNTNERKIMQSLRKGNLTDALAAWSANK